MLINSVSNAQHSFGTCIPIRLAVYRDKQGEQGFVPDEKVAGLTTALVKRLKNTNSREADFFRKNIDGFSEAQEYNIGKDKFYHKVCSTSEANENPFIKKEGFLTHLIYGDDVDYIHGLQQHLRLGNIDLRTLMAKICNSIVKPRNNRGTIKNTQEKVALTLYSDLRGGNYRLNGLEITTEDGRTIAKLPPENTKGITQKIKLEIDEDEENNNYLLYEEYLKEKELEELEKLEAEKKANEPDLLADDEFYDRD